MSKAPPPPPIPDPIEITVIKWGVHRTYLIPIAHKDKLVTQGGFVSTTVGDLHGCIVNLTPGKALRDLPP